MFSVSRDTGRIQYGDITLWPELTQQEFKSRHPKVNHATFVDPFFGGSEWSSFYQEHTQLESSDVSLKITYLNRFPASFELQLIIDTLFNVPEKDYEKWVAKVIAWMSTAQRLLSSQLGLADEVGKPDIHNWQDDFKGKISSEILKEVYRVTYWKYNFTWGYMVLDPFALAISYDLDLRITSWQELLDECKYLIEVNTKFKPYRPQTDYTVVYKLIEKLSSCFEFNYLNPRIASNGLVLPCLWFQTKVVINIQSNSKGISYRLSRHNSTRVETVDEVGLEETVKRFMENRDL